MFLRLHFLSGLNARFLKVLDVRLDQAQEVFSIVMLIELGQPKCNELRLHCFASGLLSVLLRTILELYEG